MTDAMSSSLNSDIFELLGRITVAHEQASSSLDSNIQMLVSWPTCEASIRRGASAPGDEAGVQAIRLGQLLTADLGHSRKIDLFSALWKLRFQGHASQEVADLCCRLKESNRSRNQYVHSVLVDYGSGETLRLNRPKGKPLSLNTDMISVAGMRIDLEKAEAVAIDTLRFVFQHAPRSI